MVYEGIESVVHGNSSACIEAIFKVHFPYASVVADLTWGRGRFWKWDHQLNVVGLDIDPRGGASIAAEYQHVPLEDRSVDVVVFDPPFIFSPGLRGIVGAKRFFLGSSDSGRFYEGARSTSRIVAPHNADELHQQTVVVVQEMATIARMGMVLKGQDLVVGAHPNWWTFRVMEDVAREQEGMLPEDMLIQVSPAARLHDPRWKKQLHFRRRHAIYLVYKWGTI